MSDVCIVNFGITLEAGSWALEILRMYYYILDPGKLPLVKFEKIQVELQGLLHEFNVSGEIGKLSLLRGMDDLVNTATRHGATTIVACGNDDTLSQTLAALRGKNLLLGFIPLEPQESYLAGILGLRDLPHAVKTVAGRRIIKIDTAIIGEYEFISFLEFGLSSENLKEAGFWQTAKILTQPNHKWQLRLEDSYNLHIQGPGGMLVNSRSSTSKYSRLANPTDGLLDLLVIDQMSMLEALTSRRLLLSGALEELPRSTHVPCRKLEFLEPRGMAITMFGRPIAKFPAQVHITGRKQALIVGRHRTF